MSHTLEHIPTPTLPTFIRGIYRKLKPGGKFIVIQTDVGKVAKLWCNGEISWRAFIAVTFTPANRLAGMPFPHCWAWTAPELVKELNFYGFTAYEFDAGCWAFDVDDDIEPDDFIRQHGFMIPNLGVEAIKP